MPISSKFHQRIKQLVDDCDYSRTELRAMLHISSNSFANAVVYGIVPTPKTLVKIADFFEVSFDYLLGKTDSNDFSGTVNPKTFHERFTELCLEKSITSYKVALDCGFDNSLIVRWFQKNYLPSLEILEVLCDYFNVSPDYLLGRTDFKN